MTPFGIAECKVMIYRRNKRQEIGDPCEIYQDWGLEVEGALEE